MLFVYARPDHTERTLSALQANHLAARSDLYIFADAPRPGDAAGAGQVREVISRDWKFRSVTVVFRENNLGLADNIVSGLSAVLADHPSAIVLEDDIVTAPGFLSFMNDCLVRYRDEKAIWHVNGWTYPVDHDEHGSAFFTPLMECWGWGTWRDRWRHYRRSPSEMIRSWGRAKKTQFNAGGYYDFWFDIKRNAWGVVRTWAVFWYATIFEQGGLCVSPPRSLTANIGIDGTGENSGSRNVFATVLRDDAAIGYPADIKVSVREVAKDLSYLKRHRPPFARRVASGAKWRLRRLRLWFRGR